MNRLNKSRTKKQFRFGPLDSLEERAVPAVTPLFGPAFIPPGQIGPEGIPTNNTVQVVPKTVANEANTISFDLTGPAGTYVTVAIYSAPGQPNQDPGGNLAAQRLLFSEVIQLTGNPTTYTRDIDNLNLKLLGQQHFQVDFFVNSANPLDKDDAFVAPEKLLQQDSLENISGNFIAGQLFDYTEVKNGKPKR